jgi:hypothetical protein
VVDAVEPLGCVPLPLVDDLLSRATVLPPLTLTVSQSPVYEADVGWKELAPLFESNHSTSCT